MMWTRFAITVGCIAFAYWTGFYMVVFQDWYLSWPTAGLILKALLPVALVVNVAGLILTTIKFPKKRVSSRRLALALHGIPLVAGVGFLWWLFFGVRI